MKHIKKDKDLCELERVYRALVVKATVLIALTEVEEIGSFGFFIQLVEC